jgi:hypothetical protein
MIVISEYFENIYPFIFYFLTMPLVILWINFFKHFELFEKHLFIKIKIVWRYSFYKDYWFFNIFPIYYYLWS